MENDRLGYFNLNEEGESAIVRILHSSTDTIESADMHWVETASGKKKCVKCTGEDCPVCVTGSPITHKIFIHLFDYSDNTEKVWSRTDKILPQLNEVAEAWGNLAECVVKITRLKKEFPTYSITVQNAKMYEAVSPDLIDKKIAYRFYVTRSNDELSEFLSTGIMPEHKSTYVPKEEYFKNKDAQQSSQPKSSAQTYQKPVAKPAVKASTPTNNPSASDFTDPFAVKPSRRV